jgi:hypothetical protein
MLSSLLSRSPLPTTSTFSRAKYFIAEMLLEVLLAFGAGADWSTAVLTALGGVGNAVRRDVEALHRIG